MSLASCSFHPPSPSLSTRNKSGNSTATGELTRQHRSVAPCAYHVFLASCTSDVNTTAPSGSHPLAVFVCMHEDKHSCHFLFCFLCYLLCLLSPLQTPRPTEL